MILCNKRDTLLRDNFLLYQKIIPPKFGGSFDAIFDYRDGVTSREKKFAEARGLINVVLMVRANTFKT